jgi:hypothetical protein
VGGPAPKIGENGFENVPAGSRAADDISAKAFR